MKTIVLSLGGSLIVPGRIDIVFLKRFARLMKRLSTRYKFVIVTGGGKTARKYIARAEKAGFPEDMVSLVGIESTRLNASLVAGFFRTVHFLPESFEAVRRELRKEHVVICGALGFMPEMTSDGDAALLAKYVHASLFMNLTNVKGLYTKNPKQAGARLIPRMSHQSFLDMIHKRKFRPGQHFVLDHKAAHTIQKHKMKTIILNGHNVKNLERCLEGKTFKGTIIYG